MAHPQLGDHVLGLEGGVFPEGLGGGSDRLLLGGGVGPQGVLHPVGALGQHAVGDVAGALGDKVDAHRLGADELDHLLDLLHQGPGGIGKEEVGLVKEEDQLGPVQVPGLGQLLEELGEHPQQEGGVEGGVLDQPDTVEHVDHAPALVVPAHPVQDVQVGLAEEELAPLALQRQQSPEDGGQGLGGDGPVAGVILCPVVADVAQHGPQVLQVDELQPLVVGDAEDDVQHPLLDLGEAQNAREELGPHVGDGGPHRVALLLVDVPEDGGEAGVGKALPDAELVDALLHALALFSGLADARHVPLHVAEEHGHPGGGEGFGHHLHGDGLARAAGPGDEAVAVGHVQGQHHPLPVLGQAQIETFFCIHDDPSVNFFSCTQYTIKYPFPATVFLPFGGIFGPISGHSRARTGHKAPKNGRKGPC